MSRKVPKPACLVRRSRIPAPRSCTTGRLPGVGAAIGPMSASNAVRPKSCPSWSVVSDRWVGVSVTMPGKFAALRFADERTARARTLSVSVTPGAAWLAGRQASTGWPGRWGGCWTRAGAGVQGTAPAAVVGAGRTQGHRHHRGGAQLRTRAARLVDLGTRVGVATRFCAFDSGGLADAVAAAEVLVSTIPAEVAAGHAGTLAAIRCCWTPSTIRGPPLAAAVRIGGQAGDRAADVCCIRRSRRWAVRRTTPRSVTRAGRVGLACPSMLAAAVLAWVPGVLCVCDPAAPATQLARLPGAG